MSKWMLAVVALGSMIMIGGCMDSRIGKADAFATPDYSGDERGEQIARSMEMDWRELNDDVDSVLMLRPNSTNTIWNVPSRQ